MENLYNRRVLFSFHTDPNYMKPVELSPNQIVCGPLCEDQLDGDGTPKMIKTPRGQYDIKAIIEKIPSSERPELLVVKADATRSNLPTGIALLDIPTVLIIGDTHHMHQPLRTMMQYALTERYTYYVSDHKRHHLHYFIEAGLKNVHWFPGLLVRDWQIPFQETRTEKLTFVGQAGQHHPWRRSIIEQLSNSNRPFKMGTASQDDASKIYANSQLTLNFSLNGDLNLRVFEALAAGACLLTDKLSLQSGLGELFKDGQHLVLFDDYEDLIQKIDHYLAYPNEALAIARNGYDAFHRSHHPERKRRQFLELAFNGWIDTAYDGIQDARSTAFPFPNAGEFFARLAQYEWLQDQHREGHYWRILFTPNANPKLACDLVDLPRFQVAALEPSDRSLQQYAKAQVTTQLAGITNQDLSPELTFVCICISLEELLSANNKEMLKKCDAQVIIISDWPQIYSPLELPKEIRSLLPTLSNQYNLKPASSDELNGVFVDAAVTL